VRLLYVIDSLAPGGAETSLAEMAPYLVAQGVDLHVLPLGSRLDLAERLEKGGAVVHRVDAATGRVGNVRTVLDSMRAVRPTLVHTTLFEADVAGRSAARLRRVPVSTSLVSDSYSPAHRAESPAMRIALARAVDATTARFATRFHAISGAVADAVAPRLGLRRELVEVIPRGRDPHGFPYRPEGARPRVRAALGLADNVPVVLAVGRLEASKGLRHLLAAFPAVQAMNPGVVLLIAGKDGRSGPGLRDQAAVSGCDVRFLGHRTDVADLMAAADVLCFPSEREGFGGVLIEALAVGCPVVASGIPTTVEVLGRGDDAVGVLTGVADPGDLAAALVEVLGDPAGSEGRARRGRARFEQHFTIERIAHDMASFFERVEAP
jgi:glycosyltransferase involved in cell wall biosynthesis